MSKARIIGKNISFIVSSRIVVMLVSFILLPFIINHVGKEVYGIYLVVMSVTGFFGIFDLGVMSALKKYVSEYNGKGDKEAVNRIVNASFSLYVLIGLFISCLLIVCSVYCHRFFNIDQSNVAIIRRLFIVTAISSVFVWPSSTFKGLVQGLNLWKVDAVVTILNQIMVALSTFFLLTSGYGIIALFVSMQVIIISGNLILYFIARKKIALKMVFPYTDATTFKFIFNFSFFMFLGSLIAIFLFQVHNLIIGYFISMSAVAIYAVTYNIQNYFRVINSSIGSPSWIIASEMEGAGDYKKQKYLLLKGTKYMSAIFLPAVIIMFFFVEPFINYWMGPSFQGSVLPAKIIVIFWLFNGTSELATGMLSAKGIVRRPLMIQLMTAVSNILISILLIRKLGISAVALGLTFSMVFVGFPLYLRFSLKSLGISFAEYFTKSIKKNLILYMVTLLLSITISVILYPKNLFFTLFEMAVIYCISLIFYYSRVLNYDEREDIKKVIGFDNICQRVVSIKRVFS